MAETTYINGRFVNPKKALVSMLDYGYLYGDGIFETLRSYEGHIFNLDLHIQRFFSGAKSIMLPAPMDPLSIRRIILRALKKSKLLNAYIRVTLTRGINLGGFQSMKFKKPTLSIIVRPLSDYPKLLYHKGIKTKVLDSPRNCSGNENAQIKSSSYQKNVLARIKLKRLNLTEGILLSCKGFLSEGTISNVFLIKKKILYTPSLHSGCLNGVTRQTIIRIAIEETPLQVRESFLKPNDLYHADECFFTNSLMELIPVVQVDKKVIGNGKPGKFTKTLHRGYKNLVHASVIQRMNKID